MPQPGRRAPRDSPGRSDSTAAPLPRSTGPHGADDSSPHLRCAVGITARTEDARHVDFAIDSDCEILAEFAERIAQISPVDAIQLPSPEENPILAEAREPLRTAGCCEACVVPVGAVKALYIVTNLALARDVSLKLSDEQALRSVGNDEGRGASRPGPRRKPCATARLWRAG